MKRWMWFGVMLALAVAICGCLPGSQIVAQRQPVGFFFGIWHGWLAPLSLILGLFDSNYRIYEAANRGWSYDFGFYMAIISGFGGLSLFRRRKYKPD